MKERKKAGKRRVSGVSRCHLEEDGRDEYTTPGHDTMEVSFAGEGEGQPTHGERGATEERGFEKVNAHKRGAPNQSSLGTVLS